MYGTTFKARPLPGKEAEILKLAQKWEDDLLKRATGFIAEYVLKPDKDNGDLTALVVFDSKENYLKNASSSEQDRWYREFRTFLAEDPQWADGSIIYSINRAHTPV